MAGDCGPAGQSDEKGDGKKNKRVRQNISKFFLKDGTKSTLDKQTEQRKSNQLHLKPDLVQQRAGRSQTPAQPTPTWAAKHELVGDYQLSFFDQSVTKLRGGAKRSVGQVETKTRLPDYGIGVQMKE